MEYTTGDLIAVVFPQGTWFMGQVVEQVSDITLKVRVIRDRDIGFLATGETLVARKFNSMHVPVVNVIMIKPNK